MPLRRRPIAEGKRATRRLPEIVLVERITQFEAGLDGMLAPDDRDIVDELMRQISDPECGDAESRQGRSVR